MKLALPIIVVFTAGAVGSIAAASARWRRGSTDATKALMSRAPRIPVTENDFPGVPPGD